MKVVEKFRASLRLYDLAFICVGAWYFFLLPFHLNAQSVIGQDKLKKFPTEGFDIYPYDFLDPGGNNLFVGHDPAIQVSSGEVVYLWHPERSGYRDRVLRKYNLLMELIWETEFKLERQEDILHLFASDTTVHVLTSQYQISQNQHIVRSYQFGLESGELFYTAEVWFVSGKDDHYPIFAKSPDEEQFLLYYFTNENPNRSVSFYYDFVQRDDQAGYRAIGADRMHFLRLDRSLNRLKEGFLNLGDRKRFQVGCQLDNAGNVYVTALEKPKTILIHQFHAEREEQQELLIEDFMPVFDLRDPYVSHLPVIIGEREQVYVARTNRKKRGKDKGIKGYQVFAFDFVEQRVDTSRSFDITSTLKVLVEKERENFGLKPEKRFDEYMIRDIIEMEDSSLWLVTQKYGFLGGRNRLASFDYETVDQQIDELILYEFTPTGKVRQAIIVPSTQNSQSVAERMGQFYSMEVDRKKREIRLLTREPSGEELRGPERIFYRKIQLNVPLVSDRIQIYEGERREQFFLKAYTEWLNPDIVTFLMIDGDGGNAYSVSINVVMEPTEEEAEKKKKWWK